MVTLCGFKLLTGIDCPGCGMTRSFFALARGDLAESITMHPLGVILALWFLYLIGRGALAKAGLRPRAILTPRGRGTVLFSFLAAILIQWIARLAIG